MNSGPLADNKKSTQCRRLPAISASYRDDVSGDASSSVPLTAVEDEDRRSSNGRAAYSGVSAESLEEEESLKRQRLFNQIAPMYDQVSVRQKVSAKERFCLGGILVL